MRKIIVGVILAAVATPALAQSVYVRPHVTRDGTYVEGHYRTAPNSSRSDNWSTSPNTNPYTGQQGTQNPYPTYSPPRYNPPSYSPPRSSGYQPYKPPCYYNC